MLFLARCHYEKKSPNCLVVGWIPVKNNKNVSIGSDLVKKKYLIVGGTSPPCLRRKTTRILIGRLPKLLKRKRKRICKQYYYRQKLKYRKYKKKKRKP